MHRHFKYKIEYIALYNKNNSRRIYALITHMEKQTLMETPPHMKRPIEEDNQAQPTNPREVNKGSEDQQNANHHP